MDFEVILLIIGGGISLISSILTLGVTRLIDRIGKVNIFYKFIAQEGSGKATWGVESKEDNLLLGIPVVFEVQNTSGIPHMIRDVNLLLYHKNKFICEMIQGEEFEHRSIPNGIVVSTEKKILGGDNSSYSFSLEAQSIRKIKCLFILKINASEKEKYIFDEIKIRYYNEKNKEKIFSMKKININWIPKQYDIDKNWIQLK